MDYRFDYKLFFAQPSPKGDHTGTGKLGDPKRFEQVQKCFDFVFIPRRLDDQGWREPHRLFFREKHRISE